jgi:hypothetical protein
VHLFDFVWALLAVLFIVVYFMVLFRVVLDVFRSEDLGGWGKALWFVALLVVPLVPLLVYVGARGRAMTERERRRRPEVEGKPISG